MKNRAWAAGAVSGLLSYGGTLLLSDVVGVFSLLKNAGEWLPGLVFGAMVLAPRAGGGRRWGRRAAVVALSTLIYCGAVRASVWLIATVRMPELAVCAAMGALGALATGLAARVTLPAVVGRRKLALAAEWGAAGGALIGAKGGLGLPDSLESWLLAAGFVLWQAGVGAALFPDKEAVLGQAH